MRSESVYGDEYGQRQMPAAGRGSVSTSCPAPVRRHRRQAAPLRGPEPATLGSGRTREAPRYQAAMRALLELLAAIGYRCVATRAQAAKVRVHTLVRRTGWTTAWRRTWLRSAPARPVPRRGRVPRRRSREARMLARWVLETTQVSNRAPRSGCARSWPLTDSEQPAGQAGVVEVQLRHLHQPLAELDVECWQVERDAARFQDAEPGPAVGWEMLQSSAREEYASGAELDETLERVEIVADRTSARYRCRRRIAATWTGRGCDRRYGDSRRWRAASRL